MARLSEQEQKICEELHDFIARKISECLMDDDNVFSAESLDEIGLICFQKAVNSIDGATERLLKIVLRAVCHREKFNTNADYYLNLSSFIGIRTLLKSELATVRMRFSDIFETDYPTVREQICSKIDAIANEISIVESERHAIIDRNNGNKNFLKDLAGYENRLSETYRKINDLRTTKEMLEYSSTYLTKEMESFCDLTDEASIEKTLRKMAVEKARDNSNLDLVALSFQGYQDTLDITVSNIREPLVIFFKIKLYSTVEQIKRGCQPRGVELTEDEIARFRADIDELPSVSDLIDARKSRKEEYSVTLHHFITKYGIIENLKELIGETVSIQNRKSILRELIYQFEQGNFELFANALPTQIEGLVGDYLKCGTIFQRFTDLVLYPTANLQTKLDVATDKMPNLAPELVHYFRFYFNNMIRNKVAHGVEGKSITIDVPYNVFAEELLLDLNYIIYLISRTGEAEKMHRYISGFFRWTDRMGKGEIDFAYSCLFNDLIGKRIHSDYDSFDIHNPIQVVYWIVNPYYEQLYHDIDGQADSITRLRSMLLSEGFWRFVLGELSKDSMFAHQIDENFKCIVKGLFSCEASKETKQALAAVHKKVHELNL